MTNQETPNRDKIFQETLPNFFQYPLQPVKQQPMEEKLTKQSSLVVRKDQNRVSF